VPLDESFVTAWNDGSDPRVSATTYLALQNLLAEPPAFLSHSSRPGSPARDASGEQPEPPEPTAIQKADLLMTQQWLRLVVWQSSFRQGLLSWAPTDPSTHFAFPLVIARRTASILQALPPSAVEVHGMGIFEKIFEIGSWAINVLAACDDTAAAGAVSLGAGPIMGMDFARGDDLGLLGLSRKGAAVDPLEFFVRTLSSSPNSRTQFAERLLQFAAERPGGMRMALSPTLSPPGTPGIAPLGWAGSASSTTNGVVGSVLGEVSDENEVESRAASAELFDLEGAALPGVVPPPLSGDLDLFSLGEGGGLGAAAAAAGGSGGFETPPTAAVDPVLDVDMGAALSDWSGGDPSPFGGLDSAGAAGERMDFFQDGLDGANSGYSMAGGVYQDQVAPRVETEPEMGAAAHQGYDSQHGQGPRLDTYVYRPADMGDLGVS